MGRIRALVWRNNSSLLSDLQKVKGQSANEKWVFSFLVLVHVYRLALGKVFSRLHFTFWNIFLILPTKKYLTFHAYFGDNLHEMKNLFSGNIMKNIIKYLLFFLFSPQKKWHFIQTVSHGENSLEMSKPVFLEKIRKIFQNVVCWISHPAGKK